jgi:hypothetical protein
VQVRIGSPSGSLFASGGSSGSATTGKWAPNGMVFYLQNVTGGLPLKPAKIAGLHHHLAVLKEWPCLARRNRSLALIAVKRQRSPLTTTNLYIHIPRKGANVHGGVW